MPKSGSHHRIRIIIADDHAVLCESLAALLVTQPEFVVEGWAGSHVASVVLTGSESELDYAQAVRLGARGLVLKSDGPEKLFNAIRTVANGELAFSDELAQQVLTTISAESKAPADALHRLSERERQIAYHVARGLKNKDIAH